MSVTVKLDNERKREVEKFLASVLSEVGYKVRLQEALGLMIDFSLEHRDEIIQKLRSLPPLEKDPAWRMLRKPDDWGVTDASERIDKYVVKKNTGKLLEELKRKAAAKSIDETVRKLISKAEKIPDSMLGVHPKMKPFTEIDKQYKGTKKPTEKEILQEIQAYRRERRVAHGA